MERAGREMNRIRFSFDFLPSHQLTKHSKSRCLLHAQHPELFADQRELSLPPLVLSRQLSLQLLLPPATSELTGHSHLVLPCEYTRNTPI